MTVNPEYRERTFWTDYWRKISALLLAVLVWTIISFQLETNYTVNNVKVQIQLDEDNYRVLDSELLTANLEIRNSINQRRFAQADDFVVRLPVTRGMRAGGVFKYAVNLTPDMVVEKPMFMKVVSIKANQPDIKIDVKVDKIIPVIVSETGNVKPGFAAKKEVNPQFVKIRGFSENMQNINELRTVPLDLSKSPENVTELQLLDTLPAGVDIIDMPVPEQGKHHTVKISVQVVEEGNVGTKAFMGLPVHFMNSRELAKRLPGGELPERKVDVILRAKQSVLNAFEGTVPLVYADLGNLDSEVATDGKIRKKVKILNIPYQCDVIIIEPDYVEIPLPVKPVEAPVTKPLAPPNQEQGGAAAIPAGEI